MQPAHPVQIPHHPLQFRVLRRLGGGGQAGPSEGRRWPVRSLIVGRVPFIGSQPLTAVVPAKNTGSVEPVRTEEADGVHGPAGWVMLEPTERPLHTAGTVFF